MDVALPEIGAATASSPSLAQNPPLLTIGPGAVATLREVVARVTGEMSSWRVLICFGSTASSRPWRATVLSAFPQEIRTEWVHPGGYPTLESVEALVETALSCGATVLVAVGGGTVIDSAKAAAVRLSGLRGVSPSVVAVPTTPGTGAEVTPFATLWDLAAERKVSVQGPGVLPAAAVVDPELTASLPTTQLASMALDALAQGVEAAWSTSSTPESIALGLTAVALVCRAFPALVDGERDVGVLTMLSLAGLHAGRAITISQTTACHAISYPLTARHGLQHGYACGLLLGPTMAYNDGISEGDCADPRGIAHVRGVVADISRAAGESTAEAAVDKFVRFTLIEGFDVPADVAADAPWIAAQAVTYARLGNNPRRLAEPEVEGLLAEAFRSRIGAS